MSYCPYCGAELTTGQECSCGGEKKSKVSAPKNPKKLFVPAVVVLVGIIAAIVLVTRMGSTVELSDYIVIDGVTGFNSHAVVSYRLDEDALYADLMGEENYDPDLTAEEWESAMTETFEKYDEISKAISCISLSASPESGLSNGDTVTVTAAFNNSEGYKLKHNFKEGSKTYEVSGLVDGKSFDPFADGTVSVSFTGISGMATAKIEVLADDEVYDHVSYSLDSGTALSNGDELILSADFDVESLESLGYMVPEITEQTIIVSGLGEFFDPKIHEYDTSDFDPVVSQALGYCEIFESDDADLFPVTIPSRLVGTYFLKAKDQQDPHTGTLLGVSMYNAVVIVTHYQVSYDEDDPAKVGNEYTVFISPNCAYNEAGEICFGEFDEYSYINLRIAGDDEVIPSLEEEFDDMTVSALKTG